MTFDIKDCQIDVYRSGVGYTICTAPVVAVRVTHLPTGLVEIGEHRVSSIQARSDALTKLEKRVNEYNG